MRSYSNPESAEQGEVTKLAIVEVVASAALCLSIVVFVGWWWGLSVVVSVAPFMLFRTPRSAEWALRQWQHWVALLDSVVERMTSAKDSTALAGLALLAAYLLITPIAGIFLRVTSTLYWFRIDTIREAPRNWVRQTLCTDLAHLPELVPLEALKGDVGQLRKYLAFVSPRERTSVKVLAYLLISPLLAVYVGSALYRFLFKATALVAYGPFILVAQSTTGLRMSLKARLERVTKGSSQNKCTR